MNTAYAVIELIGIILIFSLFIQFSITANKLSFYLNFVAFNTISQ